VKTPGSDVWVKAVQGQTIANATQISTGFKSSAVIALGNSTLDIHALTRLSLEEIIATRNNEKVGLNLRAGKVHVDVKPPADTKTDFTIRAPSVTASVRGTSFDMDTQGLWVSDGMVSYTGTGGASVYVARGEHSDVGAQGKASASTAITDAPPPPAGTEGDNSPNLTPILSASPAALPSGRVEIIITP
jgi:hypothetical protein